MRDIIKTLLNEALQEPGKYASGKLSDKLYLNIACDNKYWCVDLTALEDPASRIRFTTEIQKGSVEIESIEVSPKVQRKGIGSLLFSGMLEIVDVMDSVLIEQGHLPIRVIYGELRPYDPPYDQYEKSIPFYMKQAELHNLSIQFYEEDEATFQKRDISFDEALSFIDHWKCGGFRYSFK